MAHAAISGDGSRIADDGTYGDAPFGFRYADVGDPSMSSLTTDPASVPALSRDGRHLIGATYSGLLGSPNLVDLDLEAGTTSTIAPNSGAIAVSADGNHLLSTVVGGAYARWDRA